MSEHLPLPRLTEAQEEALSGLCGRYGVRYDPGDYTPQFDLPEGWVAGWIGGMDEPKPTLYVGCDPEGNISS